MAKYLFSSCKCVTDPKTKGNNKQTGQRIAKTELFLAVRIFAIVVIPT